MPGKLEEFIKGLSAAEVEADLAKVQDVVAVIEKYEGTVPLPTAAKTAITDVADALNFLSDVVNSLSS